MGVMARLARDIPSSRYITRKKDNKDNRQKINMCKSEEKHEKEGLETVEEKLGRTTLWLHEVKQLEKDVYQMGRDESVILIRRRLGQSCAELQDIQGILVESVSTNLSHRQLAVLKTETETADPSCQFFGVEWELLLSLGLNISIFKQCLATDVVDSIGLASILMDLRRVERELGDHLVALVAGRLGSAGRLTERLQNQLQQADHLQVQQAGQSFHASSGDLRTRQGMVTGSSQVKHRKNKTENLKTKIQSIRASDSQADRINRRKSTVVESSPVKKKSSFLQKVSILL